MTLALPMKWRQAINTLIILMIAYDEAAIDLRSSPDRKDLFSLVRAQLAD